jgi:hypothetical protein
MAKSMLLWAKESILAYFNLSAKQIRQNWKRFLMVFVVDLITFFSIYSVIRLFFIVFFGLVNNIQLPESVFSLSESQLDQFSKLLPLYYLSFIGLAALAVLLIIALFSLFQALSWKIALKEKIKIKYLLKSVPFGLLWLIMLSVPVILILLTFKASSTSYILLLYSFFAIYSLTSAFINYSFEEKIRVFKISIITCLSQIFFLNFIALLIPYAIFILILLAIINIPMQVSMLSYVLAAIEIAALMISLLYFTFAKFYLVEIKKRG